MRISRFSRAGSATLNSASALLFRTAANFPQSVEIASAAGRSGVSHPHTCPSLPSLRDWKGAAVPKNQQAEIEVDRRRPKLERRGEDRRKESAAVAVERRQGERRAKVQRRRQIDPTTCERDYSDQEIEFMQALEAYKRSSGRMFPTCSEILEVIRNLGYVRLPKDATSPATDDATSTLLPTDAQQV